MSSAVSVRDNMVDLHLHVWYKTSRPLFDVFVYRSMLYRD